MNHPVRRRLRLAGFDYSCAGAYFVTICTRNRRCLLGEVANGQMSLNHIGEIVARCWHEIPQHFLCTTLDAFVIMPNHVHGILLLTDDAGAGHARPLPVIMGSLKAATSKLAGTPIWQRAYWERIIRNESELNRARHYIDDNPFRWPADPENPTESSC